MRPPTTKRQTIFRLTRDEATVIQEIRVPVVGDEIVEEVENFFVLLSEVVNGSLSSTQGEGTIVDDDLPLLNIDDIAVAEGNNGTVEAVFTVSLSSGRCPRIAR